MPQYRYILEPYNGLKSRHTCPACGKNKEFVRYIDKETGQYLHQEVGRCNREEKCGYHYKPHEYFEKKGIIKSHQSMKPKQEPPQKAPSFIEMDLIKKAMKGYEINKFAQFLEHHFPVEDIYRTLHKYYIGTSNHWQGATVFPQVDENSRCRSAKIIQYDSETGKREKENKPPVQWLHTLLRKKDFNLVQCLFGQHLIPEASTVCIVESEKTAVIAALAWPQYTWIATGGKNGAKISPNLFTDKKVLLFPDLGVDWNQKAEFIPNAKVSDILEKYATDKDRNEGLDLADFLLRQPQNTEKKHKAEPKPEPNPRREKFEKMAKKNPALKHLAETFDLQVAGDFKEYRETTKDELMELAVEAIGEHNHETGDNIPHLEEMLQKGIIKPAEPLENSYYLSGSTPF
jgi:hypothetical protein